MFLLKCPNCGNNMKYQPAKFGTHGKSKRCVYCGKSFTVKDHIIKVVEK